MATHSPTIKNIPYNPTTLNGQNLTALLRAARTLAAIGDYIITQTDKIDGGGPGSTSAINFQRMVDLGEYESVEFAKDSYDEMNALKIAVDGIVAAMNQAAAKHGIT